MNRYLLISLIGIGLSVIYSLLPKSLKSPWIFIIPLVSFLVYALRPLINEHYQKVIKEDVTLMAPKVKKIVTEPKQVYKKISPSEEFKSESKPKKAEIEKPVEKEKFEAPKKQVPQKVVPIVTKQPPTQQKQTKKQKEVTTVLYDQVQIPSDDEGWVQVEKKSKPIETRQPRAQNQENIQQIQKSQDAKVNKQEPVQEVNKNIKDPNKNIKDVNKNNIKEVNKNIKEVSRQVVQEKVNDTNKKPETKQVKETKQQEVKLTKKQEKKLKKQKEQEEEELEDGWVKIEHRHVIQTQKESESPVEDEPQVKEKKRGLLSQQEYKEAKEYARQIEENFKRTQQELDERFRAKAIAKTTGYQVKQQEEAPPRVKYVAVTQTVIPQITVKPMTKEEIDQLVEAAKPKKIINLPPKEFASNTAPVSLNVIRSIPQEKQEQPKVQLKTKIIYNEIQQQQKENYIYRLQSVEFKSDKPKGERFFQAPAVAKHVVEQPKKRYQEQQEQKYVQKKNENRNEEQIQYVPKEAEPKIAAQPFADTQHKEPIIEKSKVITQKPEKVVVVYEPKQPVQQLVEQPQTQQQQQDAQPQVKQQPKIVQKQVEPKQQEVIFVPKQTEQEQQQQTKKSQNKQPKQVYQEKSPYVEKQSIQATETKPVKDDQKNGSQKKSVQEESPYVVKAAQNQPEQTQVTAQDDQKQEIKISAPLVEQVIQQLDEPQSMSQGLSKSDHKKLTDLLADNTNQLETLQEEDSFIVANDGQTLDRILPGFLDMTLNTRKSALSQNIVVQNITFEDGETVLHLETMLSILDCCREVVQDEYVKYVQKVRSERRELLKNQSYEDYLQKIVTQGEDQFHILQEGFFYIAQSLDISEDYFQHSFVYYSQHEDHGAEFIDRLTYVQQNMKEIVPSSHVVRRQQGLELIQYQLNFIEKHEENQIFKEVLDKVNKHQDLQDALPLILSTIIDDIIFQQFNLEEEDKIKFIKIHKNDKEIKAILNKIEQVVEAKFGVDL